LQFAAESERQTGVDSLDEMGTMAGMEITQELAEKVLRGGTDAIAVVRGIYQSHVEKLDALESEARKIRDAATMLPLVWIPVSERLPPNDEYVACLTMSGRPIAARRDAAGWWTVFCTTPYSVATITHWMPLPEPPAQ
jgi:hypothetical protein